MGFRFRKSFKIFPGVKLNINKDSISATMGTRGAHYTINSKGYSTTSFGIPGSGLSMSTRSNLIDSFNSTIDPNENLLNFKSKRCSCCSELLYGDEEFCPKCGKKFHKDPVTFTSILKLGAKAIIVNLILSIIFKSILFFFIFGIMALPVIMGLGACIMDGIHSIRPRMKDLPTWEQLPQLVIAETEWYENYINELTDINGDEFLRFIYDFSLRKVNLVNISAQIIFLTGLLPLMLDSKFKFTKNVLIGQLIDSEMYGNGLMSEETFKLGLNKLLEVGIIYKVNNQSYTLNLIKLNSYNLLKYFVE